MPVAHALAFALGRPLRAVVQPLRSSTIVVRAHKHSRDANVTKITRRGFALQSVLVCPCGCASGRSAWYDQYFAWNMANGMTDYEVEITPVKRRVFRHVESQRRDLGRPLDILDVGIGTGPNLVYYALNARRIVGLDPNAFMSDYAREACASSGCDPAKLSLVEGVAEAMPFENDCFDTVVCTLTLCSVPDPLAALSEMRRVLRPGGALVFVEHVQAFDSSLLRLQQSLLDPLQQALADGCHLTRDTGRLLEAQDWQSLEIDRLKIAGAALISPHVAGVGVV